MMSDAGHRSSGESHPSGKILYVEPFSGISGDMLVGALLDLGLDPARLREKLGLLPLSGYDLSVTRCERSGIHAAKFHVLLSHHEHEAPGHGHRSFREIQSLIDSSGLSDWAKQKAIEAFRRLAEAEGKIHNMPPEEVHFHEVGAMDSIIDIVGAVVLIEDLLPVRVVSAPINVGQGMLTCRHGIYPAPGPATVELLKEVPIYSNEIPGELTTPTGATLLTTFAESFGSRPLMRVGRIGYGAGDREIQGAANVLRVTLGEEADQDATGAAAEKVAVIEATLDDMNPQMYGYFQEKALSAGALDVFVVPAQMKKNRPGMLLTVVCAPDQLDAMAALIFSETTTIGMRHTLACRKTLTREFVEVQTEFGAVTLKISSSGGRRMNFAPEFECCRRLAQQKGVSLKEVMAAASRAFLESER